ncbi:MAG: RsmE family RNA methyltransferase [Minisyncoccia bacterium]
MRLHRFFVEEKIPKAGEFSVANETLLNQWRNVLRMEGGSRVILFFGDGSESLCEFVSPTGKIGKKSALLKVIETKKGLVPEREVTLYLALIKKDNFELVLEKATELGVSHIVPVQAGRSEKKGVNYERAEKILREASEQSGRVTVPAIEEIISVEKLPSDVVVFDPRGKISAREYFTKNTTAPVSLLIGPEGGFTDAEMESFHLRNIPIVSTGPQILRAETAVIVALTLALVK